MGRLAGPSRWAEETRWARQAEEQLRRRRLAAITPIAHPPASRRQLALLWYIAEIASGSLIVGRRGHPPLTDDMRALLRKQYLAMHRVAVYERMRLPLKNCLGVTPSGSGLLARKNVSDADKHYITMAMKTGVVR